MKNSYRKRAKIRSKSPQIYTRTNTIVPERSFSRLYTFFFITMMGFFIYVAIFSPALAIKTIEVKGARDNEIIMSIATVETRKNLLTKNILFFNTKRLVSEIEKDLAVKEASIKKSYPNKLLVTVKEREPRLVWEENEKRFLVDEEGLAFYDIEGEGAEYKELPKIKNNLISLNQVGDKVADEEFMDFIYFLINNFESEITDKIVFIEINTSLTEITVLTDKNYKVFFDVTKGAASQIKNLRRVKEETSGSKKKLEYIDLRVDTRIFYK